MRWSSLPAVVAICLTLAVVAACGDDDDTTAGADATSDVGAAACDDTIAAPYDPATSTPTYPAEDEAFERIIAGSFCATFSSGEAMCIAEGLVERLGSARVRQLSLGRGPWHLLGFALSNNSSGTPIDRREAEQIVDTFEGCTEDWEILLVRSVTEGASQISDGSVGCVTERLADDQARAILIGEIDRAYDDPTATGAVPFPQLIEPLVAAFDQCLSPEELDRIDLN